MPFSKHSRRIAHSARTFGLVSGNILDVVGITQIIKKIYKRLRPCKPKPKNKREGTTVL